MSGFVNLGRYPLDRPQSRSYARLVQRCKSELTRDGLFNLPGFIHPETAQAEAQRLAPRMANSSFTHARRHNIYFKKAVEGLADDHPALTVFKTSHNTLCADQLQDSPVAYVYNMPQLQRFLATVMDKPALFPMADPLAAFNVMSYAEGQALNWHFDRSEFTVTLLLQEPQAGGVFEYRTDLRSAKDPNYDGVARLLAGKDPQKIQMQVAPGTLNVFRGVNTPHRVTPVKGAQARMIAVLTYYEAPGARFSETEQLGFYGRIA
ncbi:MAG: 2OG-Fe(II) oxygenase [Alphaproteobacteria bacterium]|nr:2OG-Fe(II) oxygenase [Alphaproteobacteria bacterium]NNF25132.1 2OG-Fe(II) oxygenase [Paracoccaceae bacterium]